MQKTILALGRLMVVCFLILCVPCCASSDDLKPIAEAGNAAKGGAADSATGQRRVDSNLKAGVTTTGDNQIDDHGVAVEAQRNTSATAAGSTYSAVTIAAGGGQDALQKAVETDPIVELLKAEIAKLGQTTAEADTTARLDELRSKLEARLDKIADDFRRASPAIHVEHVTQTITAPSTVNSIPAPLGPHDVGAAKETTEIVATAKGVPPKSLPVEPSPATSKPVEKDPTSDQ